MVGAMNVNIPAMGIHVASLIYSRFQSIQPQDAARDQIGVSCIFGQLIEVVANGNASLENHSDGLPGTNSLADFMQASWRAQ